MERGGKISTDFFIEIYPIVRRLSKEEEYSSSDGIEKLTDGFISKFLAGKAVTDVKDFRNVRKALAFYEEKQNFVEFKRRVRAFLDDPNSDLSLFTDGVEEEQNIAALTKYTAIVLSILENANPNAFSDAYVVDMLKRLSDKIKSVLEEIE